MRIYSETTETVNRRVAESNGEVYFEFFDHENNSYFNCGVANYEFICHHMILCTRALNVLYIIEMSVNPKFDYYFLRRKIWFDTEEERALFIKHASAI